MRKNFAKIACLGAASLSLLAGCGVIDQLKEGRGLGKVTESAAADSESAEEEILMEDDFAEIPVSGAWIPDSVETMNSETEPDQKIRHAIVDYYEVPDEELANTRYYYNHVDLNDDGKDEILVLAVGQYVGGSGGTSALLLNDDMTVRQAFTAFNAPVVISEESTNGYHNLVLERTDGGSSEIVELTASEDGIYENVWDTEKMVDPNELKGTAVICDNMTYDENADVLTLED